MRNCKLPAVVIAIAILLFPGCTNTESLRRDVLEDRKRAYNRWHDRGDRKSETVINGNLSLQDAVKLAIVHSRSLRAVVEEKEIVEGRIVESYSMVLPTVSAASSYTRLDEVLSFDVGGKNVSFGSENNYSVGLKIQQPLYRGGAIGAALRAAKIYSYLADEQVRGAVQETVYQTAAAHFEALFAQYLRMASEEVLKTAEARLSGAVEAHVQGLASRLDVLEAETNAAKGRAEVLKQKNWVRLLKADLLRTMGVSQESDVIISGELTYKPIKIDFKEAVRAAYENRPDLYRAELAVRLQKEAVAVAGSEGMPQLDLTFTSDWGSPDPHNSTSDEWGEAWSGGIALQWTLFSGLRQTGQMLREKAALRQRKILLMDAEEGAVFEIRQAVLELENAAESVRSRDVDLNRERETFRLTEAGYQEGVESGLAVADARAALARIEGLYYQAVYNHAVGRLILQKAMGVLGPKRFEKEGK